MLVSKIKPLMTKCKHLSTVKLQIALEVSYHLFDFTIAAWIAVVILELIHAKVPISGRDVFIRSNTNVGTFLLVLW